MKLSEIKASLAQPQKTTFKLSELSGGVTLLQEPEDAGITPGRGDFEALMTKEARNKQMLQMMQGAHQKIQQIMRQDPRNWTSDELKEYYKNNPPKTPQEKAMSDAAIQIKEDREKGMTDQIVAERYAREDLAKKIIPQFTKGLQESDLGRAAQPLMNRLPNAGTINEIQQNMPAPQGVMPAIARVAGNVLPYMALSQPFIAEAEAAPAISGLSKLAKQAIGTGAYEGTKKIVSGKPQEAPLAAGEGAATSYLFGKGTEAVGKGFQKGLEFAKSGGARVINSLIKPLLKDFSYGKNPGRSVAQERIVANSLDELAVKIKEKSDEIGNKIGQILRKPENASKRINLSQAVDPIDNAIANASKHPKTNRSLIERLQNLRDDIFGVSPEPNPEKTGRFVILQGSESKAVSPQITKTYSSDIRGPLRSLRGEKSKEIFTPRKYVENPEDIVALNLPKQGAKTQKLVSVSPKEEVTRRAEEIVGGYVPTSPEITNKLKSVTPVEAAAFKADIGDLTKWTGAASDDQIVNKALKQTYGVIKQKINAAVPETVKLNETYADLRSAEIATKYRDKIGSRQNLMSITGKLAGGGLFLTGLMKGDVNMVMAGASEPLIEYAMGSPAIKTRLAATLARIPTDQLKELVSKYPSIKQIPSIAARIAVPLTKGKNG